MHLHTDFTQEKLLKKEKKSAAYLEVFKVFKVIAIIIFNYCGLIYRSHSRMEKVEPAFYLQQQNNKVLE